MFFKQKKKIKKHYYFFIFFSGLHEFPSIGFFRNGHFIIYEGEEDDKKEIYDWISDEETLKIVGVIDEVNLAMLENILDEQDDAFVFFYEEGKAIFTDYFFYQNFKLIHCFIFCNKRGWLLCR